MRQQPPLGSRTWKPEEEDYLMEKWGQISVPAIAKKLNRTTNAVKVRAQRLGLGEVLMAGEYVTLNQLLLAVTGGSSSYGYKMKSWVENRGGEAGTGGSAGTCSAAFRNRRSICAPMRR